MKAAWLIPKLAARNLLRHTRRTAITALTIGLGLALLIMSAGIGDGYHLKMIEAGIGFQAGHVVIQGQGYQQSRQASLAVPDTPRLKKKIAQMLPAATVVERVFLEGLLTSPNNSVGVAIGGVDPHREKEVNDFYTKIIEGSELDGSPAGLLAGQTLARTLGVSLGDKVVLMAQRGGEIESRLFRVQGIFKSGLDEVDGFYARIPLRAAQEFLGLGENVTQISVHLTGNPDVPELTALLRAGIGSKDVEVLSWMEALPEIYEFVVLDDAGLYVMILIIALIAALGILNTMLMSVLERVREFGVLLALGVTPGRLVRLVLAESFFLGLAAVAVGVIVGGAANWYGLKYGIDLSSMIGGESVETAGVLVDAHIYAHHSWAKVGVFSLLTLGMTMLAALYPAHQVTKMKPVAAMTAV